MTIRALTLILLTTLALLPACGGEVPTILEAELGGKAEPALEASCSATPAVTLTRIADPSIDAYDYLLQLVLQTDMPFAVIGRYAASGCVDVAGSHAARAAVTAAVIENEFSVNEDENVRSYPFAQGSDSFLHQLYLVASELDERVTEANQWIPATPAEEALVGLRGLLEQTLEQEVASAGPGSLMEVLVSTDGEECSEFAVGLFNRADSTILIIRIYPRCI